jgi:hypothetical protein
LSLCFNWVPRHEGVLEEWRYSSTPSLTSALNGGEWSASRPGRFAARERAPVTHWIGGWVGPRAVLKAVMKRNIPSPRRESNTRTPIVQLVAQRYTDWPITAVEIIVLVSMHKWTHNYFPFSEVHKLVNYYFLIEVYASSCFSWGLDFNDTVTVHVFHFHHYCQVMLQLLWKTMK